MINIFSDASCRNFGNIKGINSYFVGTGLTHNLSSKDGCDLILDSINKIDYVNSDNYLFFGEYDVRLSMGFGNLPHQSKRLRFRTNKKLLNQIVNNYVYLINSLPIEFKIITPISSFIPEIDSLNYFSTKIITMYPNKIIDLFSNIFYYGNRSNSIEVVPEYKSKNYNQNPYICNTDSIGKLLCDTLGFDYEFEEKGNMHLLGSFYIQ